MKIFEKGRLQERSFIKSVKSLSAGENTFFIFLLSVVLAGIVLDVATDVQTGESWIHLTIDSVLGIFAVLGIIFVWLQVAGMRIIHQRELLNALSEAQEWKSQFDSVKGGITDEIDLQFKNWKFTPAESEVAIYLIKGMSLKEISSLRGTTEKTVRHQTLSVYSKAGVAGRAELAAYFIEDLFVRSSDEIKDSQTTSLNRG